MGRKFSFNPHAEWQSGHAFEYFLFWVISRPSPANKLSAVGGDQVL